MGDLRASVLQRLDNWRRLGDRVAKSGAIQIGRVPHVAPLAWLHCIFASITEAEQRVLVDRVSDYSNSALRAIHAEFNGIDLFSSNFFLYGRRINYERTIDTVLPWDLANANDEVRRRLPKGAVLVGGSNALPDGVSFLELAAGNVIAVEKQDWNNVLFEWATLQDCLRSEIDRLSFLFDESGRPIDKAALANFGLRRM